MMNCAAANSPIQRTPRILLIVYPSLERASCFFVSWWYCFAAVNHEETKTRRKTKTHLADGPFNAFLDLGQERACLRHRHLGEDNSDQLLFQVDPKVGSVAAAMSERPSLPFGSQSG